MKKFLLLALLATTFLFTGCMKQGPSLVSPVGVARSGNDFFILGAESYGPLLSVDKEFAFYDKVNLQGVSTYAFNSADGRVVTVYDVFGVYTHVVDMMSVPNTLVRYDGTQYKKIAVGEDAPNGQYMVSVARNAQCETISYKRIHRDTTAGGVFYFETEYVEYLDAAHGWDSWAIGQQGNAEYFAEFIRRAKSAVNVLPRTQQ